jgi:hypothetical protein
VSPGALGALGDTGGVIPPTIITAVDENAVGERGGGSGVSDNDPQGPDGEPAHGRYVVGRWGSAPEQMYLAAITGGLSGIIHKLTGSPALGVRRIPQRGAGFVRCEVLAPGAHRLAEVLKSADMAEIARLGPWVSEWPSYWSPVAADRVEVDLGKINPVWYVAKRGPDYIAGMAEAKAAKAVFSDALGSSLCGGPMAVKALCRDDGCGAVLVDLAPWDGEWLWLVLTHLGAQVEPDASPLCERAHDPAEC